MKLALITDTHYGIKGDHSAIIENNKRFFDDVFFPYLHRNRINQVVHLGDLVDRRKYINFNTAQRLRLDFIEPMLSNGITFDWILGNHDIYNREDLEISAASEMYSFLARGNRMFRYFDKPHEREFDGIKILYLPWICDANRDFTTESINNTDAQILFGHLELAGFEMYKGIVQDHGEDPAIYQKFDIVCTGHYHHRSYRDGIHYLGSHGDFTWSDCGDSRGFHVFDTDTRKLDFIENPYPMYRKVWYDETLPRPVDFENIQGKFIKVIVKNRSDSDKYNAFITAVEAARPLEIQVVEDHLNLDLTNDENIVSETKDTLTILREYVAQANNLVNVSKLDKLVIDLYQKAQAHD